VNATTDNRLTLGSLLFGQADGDAIGRALHERGALDNLAVALDDVPAPLRNIAVDRIGHAATEPLGVDVVEALKLGWQKYGRLRDAGAKTLAAPGSEEIVDLASHRITSTFEPKIDVFIDEVRRAIVDLRLDLRADVHAVQAIVSEGRMVALRSGKADLEGALSCNGVEVRSVHRTIDLDLELGLGSGLVLARPAGGGLPDPPATSIA
jgi:hypothetical protein